MTTAAERVEKMMKALGKDQPGFALISGASKSVVNQWLSGEIKSISARYAFKIQKESGFNAEWIQTGEGPDRVGELKYKTSSEAPTEALFAKEAEPVPQALLLFDQLSPKQQQSILVQMEEMVAENNSIIEAHQRRLGDHYQLKGPLIVPGGGPERRTPKSTKRSA